MHARHYGNIAFSSLATSLCAFIFANSLTEQQTHWHMIGPLAVFMCTTSAIIYIKSDINNTQYLRGSMAISCGVSLYFIEVFWANYYLLTTSLLMLSIAFVLSNYVFRKYYLRPRHIKTAKS